MLDSYYSIFNQKFNLNKIHNSLKNRKDQIKGMKFCQILDDNTFDQLTKKLIPETFKSLKIIDISNNNISKLSAKNIISWLEISSEPFIIVRCTRVMLKNIEYLYDKMFDIKQSGEIVLNLLKKVIFMSNDYINIAKRKKIYQNLVKKNKLPTNWNTIHQNFYKNNIHFKNFMNYLKMIKYNEFVRHMDELAKNAPHHEYNDDALHNKHNDDDDDFIFSDAYKLFTKID